MTSHSTVHEVHTKQPLNAEQPEPTEENFKKRSEGGEGYLTPPPVTHCPPSYLQATPLPLYQAMVFGTSLARVMVDSGASACFISATYARKLGIRLLPLPKPVVITGAGRATTQHTAMIILTIAGALQCIVAYVVSIEREWDIILGDTWIEDHGALVDPHSKAAMFTHEGEHYRSTPFNLNYKVRAKAVAHRAALAAKARPLIEALRGVHFP